VLKQFVPVHDDAQPLHEAGEVVLVTLGNYLEERERCQPKMRPAIILSPGPCQHTIIGLTTKPAFATSGQPRAEIPAPIELGLERRRSFLWAARPSRLCRLDVRRHLGWVDLDTVELLSKEMLLPRWMLVGLMRAAAAAHRGPIKPK
jgi:hypothetical protein